MDPFLHPQISLWKTNVHEAPCWVSFSKENEIWPWLFQRWIRYDSNMFQNFFRILNCDWRKFQRSQNWVFKFGSKSVVLVNSMLNPGHWPKFQGLVSTRFTLHPSDLNGNSKSFHLIKNNQDYPQRQCNFLLGKFRIEVLTDETFETT